MRVSLLTCLRNDKLDVLAESCFLLVDTTLYAHNPLILSELNFAESRVVTTNLEEHNIVLVVEAEASQMIAILSMEENLNFADNMVLRDHNLYHGLTRFIFCHAAVAHNPVPLTVLL